MKDAPAHVRRYGNGPGYISILKIYVPGANPNRSLRSYIYTRGISEPKFYIMAGFNRSKVGRIPSSE